MIFPMKFSYKSMCQTIFLVMVILVHTLTLNRQNRALINKNNVIYRLTIYHMRTLQQIPWSIYFYISINILKKRVKYHFEGRKLFQNIHKCVAPIHLKLFNLHYYSHDMVFHSGISI